MTGNEQTTVVKKERGEVEFIPYGAKDNVRLNINIVKTLVAVPTKSGKTCSDNDALKFIAMCQAKRINPFEGDCFLIGYDGREGPTFSLITAHQTYLKRAELHPEFDGMKSGIIVEEDGKLVDLEGDFHTGKQRPVGGWAKVFFKNRKEPMHKRVRLSRFQKSFGVWQDDPAGMICKCAEADALRSSFPTMLGGLYLREEVESKLEFAKPAFAEPSKPALFTAPQAAIADAPAMNQVKAVRGLCKEAKIEEAELLDLLMTTGAADKDTKTLEELNERRPETMLMLTEQWADVSQVILDTKAEAAKQTTPEEDR